MNNRRLTRIFGIARGIASAASAFLCLVSASLVQSCAAMPKGKIDWSASRAASAGAGYASAEAWEEDLAFLERTLEERHPSPWHAAPRAAFSAALRAGGADARPGAQAVAEARAAAVARALALLGEGHTRLVPQLELARGLGLSVSRGADGYYVLGALATAGADSPALDLVGGRIVSIGDVPMDEAAERLRPFVSAENELAAREQIARILPRAGFLVAAGLAGAQECSVRIEVELSGRRLSRELAFDPAAFGDSGNGVWKDAFELSPIASARTLPTADPYRYEYFPESGALFFQYNSCSESPDLSFRKFCAGLFEAIERGKPERLVIDLRNNGGGNSALFTFGFMPRIKRSYLNERGRLFVLIGPRVFSSGVFAAHELRVGTQAIFVGEPTGQGPNHYGYTGYFSLPNTGLAIMHSTRYWKLESGSTEDSIRPDIAVPKDIPAILAGRDTLAEAALTFGR